MPKKQSSSRLSTIAGRVLKQLKNSEGGNIAMYECVKVDDVRALAASVLSQDEQPGQHKRVTTFTVKPGKDFGWTIWEGKGQIGFSPRKVDAIKIACGQARVLRPSRVVVDTGTRMLRGDKMRKVVKEYK